MVNLHSSARSPEVGLAFMRLWHVLGGIYFWEFISTLDYEWKVFRGHLPYRWTIWIYFLARVACLLGVILNTFGLDTTGHINCQLWVSFLASFFCTSLAFSSLLIVLRIIAIWNKNKVITVASIGIWVFGVAFHINATVRVRSHWDPQVLNCLSISTERGVVGLVPTIFADVALLLIMLVGLLLLRRSGGGMFGLTPILWRQGLIWMSVALASEIPPAVVACLSTNSQFTNLILMPGLIIMTIAATRMHRSLVDYASGFPDVVSRRGNAKLSISGVSFSKTKRVKAASLSPAQIEVAVHTDFLQHTTTQMNDHESYITTLASDHVNAKPSVWDIDDDVERGT